MKMVNHDLRCVSLEKGGRKKKVILWYLRNVVFIQALKVHVEKFGFIGDFVFAKIKIYAFCFLTKFIFSVLILH